MKILFRSQELWDLVENGYTEPANAAALAALTQNQRDILRDNRKKDQKALLFIVQGLDETLLPRVTATSKAKEAWDLLAQSFQGTDRVRTVRLQILRGDFEVLQMTDSESLGDFFTRTMEIINQMK
eukprot:Gb_14349 [translate_table: standard]